MDDIEKVAKEVVDYVARVLPRLANLTRTEETKSEYIKTGTWRNLDRTCFSGTQVDHAYVSNGVNVAMEFETSYLDSSHDLLKLAWCAYVKFRDSPFLAVIVTTWLSQVPPGPQRNVYPRLEDEIRELRSRLEFFRSFNLALVGIKQDKSTVQCLWPTGSDKAIEL